jgi:hypothetical protein
MRLEDVLDSETGVLQDEWTLTQPTFGKNGQLGVVGWSGRDKSGNKYYILKCSKCSQDSELFGEGYFRSVKCNLVKGRVPCGCSKKPEWSQEQYSVLCSRKAKELGYTFLGLTSEWKGRTTKIKMSCEKHGEWLSGAITNLINIGTGCPECGAEASIKPDDIMIDSFFASKAFHPDTKFWRSERLRSSGWAAYWHMYCPMCGEVGESLSGDLQKGHRPCACSKQRQQECYINWVVDEHNNAVAIKFGIARDSKQRIKNQNRQSVYEVRQHQVYVFSTTAACKAAERECKKSLVCGVLLRRDMPDGYTETTHSNNLTKVIDIYKKHGGVLVVSP